MGDSTIALLWEGARPKTLPASLGPVIAAAGLTVYQHGFSLVRIVLAGGVALFLQIGTNYANDYSDGVRGTDEVRSGPRRLVASKAMSAASVKRAAFVAFGVAGVLGLVLCLLSQWWLIGVGAAAILAGWFYTGGSKPYGYYGFGELFVFVFFGLVETLGTVYVQTERLIWQDWAVATALGLQITGILVANNLRDISGDVQSGKKTLAVRIGDRWTRALYVACFAGSAIALVPLGSVHPLALFGVAACALAIPLSLSVLRGANGPALIPVLVGSGRVVLVTSLALGVTLAL
ncbi:MAG: 1,4-dihydroxy-2-naphthoate polyprenyltransferase [Acidimicrobiales bacterium]